MDDLGYHPVPETILDDNCICPQPGDEDYERDDPLVLYCNTPGCLMPGEHFLGECHTAEDMEAEMERQEGKI